MKQKKNIVFGMSLALLGVMVSLQACGQGMRSRVESLRGLDSGASGPIPTNTSANAVSPYLLGTYTYQQSGCRLSSGDYIPVMPSGEIPSESITISDRQVVRDVLHTNGCRVQMSFTIAGIDSSTLALTNRSVQVTLNGLSDSTGACSSLVPPMSPSGVLSLKYQFRTGDLSFFTPPTDPCESDEQNQDIYAKF